MSLLEVARQIAAGGAPVRVDVFAGLWHDFPMYAEGCGAKLGPLWQGELVLRRVAHFLAAVSEHSQRKCMVARKDRRRPLLSWYYSAPGGEAPWSMDEDDWLPDCALCAPTRIELGGSGCARVLGAVLVAAAVFN